MTAEECAVGRRWIVGTVGIGVVAGLAGCLGGDGDDSEEPVDGDDDSASSGEDDGEEATLSEPVDFPEDEDEGGCAVCNMVAAEYPDWNAQLVHDDGHREYLCSKGCLMAYYFAPEKFSSGDPDEEIAGVWATCFQSGELIDATEAFFVYEQDRERHNFPMPMGSPLAFSDRADAVSYTEEYDDLAEDDHILTLQDVDREVAETYREPRLEAMRD